MKIIEIFFYFSGKNNKIKKVLLKITKIVNV
ncbi:hypothetical protein LCGC14_2243730, partial [marine sediment metagenome]